MVDQLEKKEATDTKVASTPKAKLAVFDFDGTLIPIQSGAHLS